jgi:hypothetical protein
MKRLLLAILLSGIFSQAAHAEQGPESIYPFYCGTKEEVLAASGGGTASEEEWNELIEQRSVVLQTLLTPKESLKKMYEEGSKNDTGPFGVLMACGIIVQLNPRLAEKGCVDLKTNQVVRDQGAVALCQDLIARLGK